jgi:hypothetical protein
MQGASSSNPARTRFRLGRSLAICSGREEGSARGVTGCHERIDEIVFIRRSGRSRALSRPWSASSRGVPLAHVPGRWHDLLEQPRLGRCPVGHDFDRYCTYPQRWGEQRSRRGGIAAGRDEDVDDLAMLIDRTVGRPATNQDQLPRAPDCAVDRGLVPVEVDIRRLSSREARGLAVAEARYPLVHPARRALTDRERSASPHSGHRPRPG